MKIIIPAIIGVLLFSMIVIACGNITHRMAAKGNREAAQWKSASELWEKAAVSFEHTATNSQAMNRQCLDIIHRLQSQLQDCVTNR